MPFLPEGHVQEDFIEVDDDDYSTYSPIESMSTVQTPPSMTGPRVSPSVMHNGHEFELNATDWMAWPTAAASEEPFATTTTAAQVYLVESGNRTSWVAIARRERDNAKDNGLKIYI